MADNTTTGSNTQDLNELLRQSPFGPLLDIEKADGSKVTVGDIFGNLGAPGGSNPFAGGAGFGGNSPYGGNPFAGDNFWNLFAGGVNPSNTTGNAPAGGGIPSGSNGTPVNPFANDDSFWEIFGGGVNPAEFSSNNIPIFAGGNSPQGFPTNGSSTPVPEPSSVLGLAVIGLGIAATKFKQHQRRTARVFNK
ncbi:PEP-CTERM sorting domain-containing protein [Synechocystis sp. PCC 7509]|uniref:PEP-CTERM sorting domain-containing protein n=1 Tax=Synechocystis sp. PCC 7509 TaxID=927677 RepID=UPI0002AC2EAB|nr:PEP-CTERM sorting domain-containing protein [Synechocystis sp. PCC 7509]